MAVASIVQSQNNITNTLSPSQSQFSFNRLSVDDGLSQNSVVSIAQDSTGFLWFATQDGLNKYDGSVLLTSQNTLMILRVQHTASSVNCMLIDREFYG